MSQVDIVPQPLTTGGAGGEILHLFNTGEKFVGSVVVLPEPWLVALKGEKAVSGGSTRAPMRK